MSCPTPFICKPFQNRINLLVFISSNYFLHFQKLARRQGGSFSNSKAVYFESSFQPSSGTWRDKNGYYTWVQSWFLFSEWNSKHVSVDVLKSPPGKGKDEGLLDWFISRKRRITITFLCCPIYSCISCNWRKIHFKIDQAKYYGSGTNTKKLNASQQEKDHLNISQSFF